MGEDSCEDQQERCLGQEGSWAVEDGVGVEDL